MTPSRRLVAVSMILLGAPSWLPRRAAAGQAEERDPSRLIGHLTRKQIREGATNNPCGEILSLSREDRSAANSLVGLGAKAVPDIEVALDSVEARGSESPYADGAAWLALTYARIKGPAAYPRLMAMLANTRLDFLQNALDNATAVAFGITSYISRPLGPTSILDCRPAEPRDGLDQMILAWRNDDQVRFEASLGPAASAALKSLLAGRTWADFRAYLWHPRSSARPALGYRFRTQGAWSEPEETLDERLQQERQYPTLEANPKLDTLFKGGSGRDCGVYRIEFRGVPIVNMPAPPLKYLVDNPNLGDLLRLIASCVSPPEGH
jgi:hypothetical protein